MATHSLIYLGLKINGLLDGQAFFDHWKEKFRSPQAYGPSIKALCPFHIGESFRSFLLDLRHKTFRCTFTACKAAAGGTLPDLHALLLDKSLLEALLDLRATFRLELPDEVQADLAQTLADHARELLRAKDLETAENVAALAFREDPTNTALRLLLAEICEASGRPDAARPYYELALEQSVAEHHWSQAKAILDRLRALYPDQIAYIEQSLKTAQARGDPQATVACYVELGRRSDVSIEQRHEWLEQAHALEPERPDVLEQLGAVYEQLGRTHDAVLIWKSLADGCRSAGQPEKALDVLERITRLCPDRDDLREERADILLAAGRTGEASDLLQTLAERAVAQGAVERAERYLRRLSDVRPSDVDTGWQLVTLLEQTNRVEEAVRVAERVLAVSDPAAAGPRYSALLERLKQWKPDDTGYRGRIVAHYANRGNAEAALNELRQLVALCFQKGARADALQHIEGMRAQVQDHPRRRLELARILAEHDCRVEALREYETVARMALGSDPQLAEEACVLGLELDPAQTSLHEIRLQLVMVHRPDEVLEHCRRIIEVHRAQGTADKSLAVLVRVTQRMPRAIEVRLLLVNLAVEIGQPERALAELQELAEMELASEQQVAAIQAATALAERTSQAEAVQPIIARLRGLPPPESALGSTVRERRRSARSEEVLVLIDAAIRNSDPPEAMRLLHRALETDPKNVELRERWIALLFDQKRFEEARRALEDLADLLSESDDSKQCIEGLEQAVRRFPRAPVLHERLGDFYLAVSATGRALGSFKKAVRLHEDAGEHDLARALAEKVLLIDPPDMTLRLFLIESLITADQLDKALAHSRVLAGYYTERNLYDLAEREFRRIVARMPDDLGAWQKILEMIECMGKQRTHVADYLLTAKLALQRGLTDEALRIFRQTIELNPENTEARRAYIDACVESGVGNDLVPEYLELADRLALRGRADEALQFVRKVLALQPDHPAAQALRQRLEAGPEAVETLVPPPVPPPPDESERESVARRAIDEYMRILDSAPDNPVVRSHMADLLSRVGERDAAVREWDAAASQFLDRGEYDRVQHLCEKILQVEPQHARARERLSRAALWKDSLEAVDRAIKALEGDA